MNPAKPILENGETTKAAAAWWMRLQDDEAAGFSTEFQEWISNSANEQEFHAIELTTETLGELGTTPAIAEMRRSARNWLAREGAPRDASSWVSRKSAHALAAAVLVLAVAGGAFYLRFVDRPLSYATSVGQRRAVALQDGSHILLDSNSEVDIRYSRTARAVALTKGRARFDVAHDKARPFSVTADNKTVVAVGTSFDVELRGSKVLVTLIQGRVLVNNAAGSAPPSRAIGTDVALSAGQQLVAYMGRQPVITPADFAVTQAWEVGHIVFRGERLADAVEQINRYTGSPIIVDPSAASFRVSGVFSTADMKAFISAATEFYPLEAVPGANGAVTLRRRP